jgi:uncharacterized membrane protein YbhN (UPF0104 family)
VVAKRIIRRIFWYGAGAAILAYVLAANWSPPGGDPGLAAVLSRPVSAPSLAIAALLSLLGLLVNFYRWAVLVRAQRLPLSLGEALRLGFLGHFLSTFLPGAIGGDVVRAAFFARAQSRRAVAVSTVVMDRLLGLLGLFWLVAAGGAAAWALGHPAVAGGGPLWFVVLTCAGVVAGTALPWLLLGWLPASATGRLAARSERLPVLGSVLAEVGRAVMGYRSRPGTVAYALALSLAAHSCYVVSFWAAASMFPDPGSPPPSLAEHFVLVPVGAAVQMVVPSPGGVGAGEYSFGQLYALAGRAGAAGVLACLAYRLVLWGWGAVGYFGCLALRQPGLTAEKGSCYSPPPTFGESPPTPDKEAA